MENFVATGSPLSKELSGLVKSTPSFVEKLCSKSPAITLEQPRKRKRTDTDVEVASKSIRNDTSDSTSNAMEEINAEIASKFIGIYNYCACCINSTLEGYNKLM